MSGLNYQPGAFRGKEVNMGFETDTFISVDSGTTTKQEIGPDFFVGDAYQMMVTVTYDDDGNGPLDVGLNTDVDDDFPLWRSSIKDFGNAYWNQTFVLTYNEVSGLDTTPSWNVQLYLENRDPSNDITAMVSVQWLEVSGRTNELGGPLENTESFD